MIKKKKKKKLKEVFFHDYALNSQTNTFSFSDVLFLHAFLTTNIASI